MPIFLVILFIALPIAELYLIIQLGGAIGVLPTIGILILDSFLGVALLRSQGRNVWARFNQTMAEGRLPAREVFDGAMVILGGALLLTPGFITDVFGLILLIPPTRDLVRGAAAWLARRRARPVSWYRWLPAIVFVLFVAGFWAAAFYIQNIPVAVNRPGFDGGSVVWVLNPW